MGEKGRYCVQKISYTDREKSLVVWVETKVSSDDLETLKLFCGARNRIFDRETGKVVYKP